MRGIVYQEIFWLFVLRGVLGVIVEGLIQPELYMIHSALEFRHL